MTVRNYLVLNEMGTDRRNVFVDSVDAARTEAAAQGLPGDPSRWRPRIAMLWGGGDYYDDRQRLYSYEARVQLGDGMTQVVRGTVRAASPEEAIDDIPTRMQPGHVVVSARLLHPSVSYVERFFSNVPR